MAIIAAVSGLIQDQAYGALYRRNPAARREGAVFDQCALDILPAVRSRRGSWRSCSWWSRVWSATDVLMLICLAIAAIAALVALYWTVTAWFHRWTTETDVTNLRVVHKTGFIKRRTFEMSLDKVESVDVNQSILGRILELRRCHDSGRRRGHARPSPPLPRRSRFAMPSPPDRSVRSHGDAAEILRRFFLQRQYGRPGRSREILETVGRVVGSPGQDGPAAQDQPAAARLHPRRGLPQVRAQRQKPELPVGPAHPRYRLRRRAVVRAADAAGRAGDRDRSVRDQYRRREAACRQGASVDRLPLHHGRGRWTCANASTSCWRWK